MIAGETITRRKFVKLTGLAGISLSAFCSQASAMAKKIPPVNIVIISTDDNDADSLGCYGSPLPGVTPNLDKLAAEGVRFEHAHTASPTCQPSRLCLMTGRYPQTNGNTGHATPLKPGVPTLSNVLREAGYYTAIVGKQPNYIPESQFNWTRDRDDKGVWLTADTWDYKEDGYWGMWREPEGFYKGTKFLVSEAKQQNKPFFLHLNTSDPHRPWPGNLDEMDHLEQFSRIFKKRSLPLRPYSKNYSPFEIPVPEYLPDLPGVRVDVAQYYSAMHNGDKAAGRIIDALGELDELDNTAIIYFADQGAPFPMSKQNLYRYSTRIPLIIKWPGVTPKDEVIDNTMVSIIDIMPTIIEALQIKKVEGMDGKSFFPLIYGQEQDCRDHIFASYNFAKPGIQAYPMRSVQSKKYLYIFNGWYGERNINPDVPLIYDGAIDPLTGHCWKSMKEAAATDEKLKERVNFIKRRLPEEFYDLTEDPYCFNNLINDKKYALKIEQYKKLLEKHLREVSDPIIARFQGTGPLPEEWLTFKKK